MPINVADRIVGLIVSMEPKDIADLPPATRQWLGAHCRHVAALCELKPEQPKAGVISDLRDGRGRE